MSTSVNAPAGTWKVQSVSSATAWSAIGRVDRDLRPVGAVTLRHDGAHTRDRGDALLKAIEPHRSSPSIRWDEAEPTLEDIFIHLMGKARDNALDS